MTVKVATFNTFMDLAGKTLCLSQGGVAVGSTATKVKSAASNGAGIDYAIDGLLYHKADTDDLWTLSGTALVGSTTNTGQACIFGLLLDTSGTATIVQGDIKNLSDVNGGNAVIPFPVTPVSKCMVGAVLVATNSDTTFTPGTTSLAASGVTDTYFNFIVPPNEGLNADHV